MSKKVVLSLCVLLAFSRASVPQPRDLAEEAEELLQQLLSTVQSRILAAHSDLDEWAIEFYAFSVNMFESGQLYLQRQRETIDSELSSLKDLAHSSGSNVSSCIDNREEVLNNLPIVYREQITKCINGTDAQREMFFQDTKYLVDVSISPVYSLENQLQQCQSDILCLSPLVTQLELYKIQLPENIDSQMFTLKGMLNKFRQSVEICSDFNISYYVRDATSVLEEIIACIDATVVS